MKHDTIAVMDFGGQYAHLIATKIRRSHVRAEIVQPEDSVESYAHCKGLILSGSPALASQGEGEDYNRELFELPIPILGFCFGHQEIAKYYGGDVKNDKQEWGRANLHILKVHPLFKGLAKVEQVWMSHNDTVTAIGPDFEELGYTILGADSEPHHFAAIASDKLKRYGFQYHPEVDDTLHGDEMIANFVFEICACEPSWTMESYLAEQLEAINKQAADKSVFLLASGGVDSTVAALLFKKSLGAGRLKLLHIDNGLMRKGESAKVVGSFADMGIKDELFFVDASDEFLKALEGLAEPEEKRRAIGDTFVAVFEKEAKRLGLADHLLGQGTIYPDTIETGGTKRSDTIKTHHNRVPIIEELISQGKVIEPLADLYKVEVRELGLKLGVPEKMLNRHPFPGPGLGVRLLCVKGDKQNARGKEESDRLNSSDALNSLLNQHGLEGVVLPIQSVGVKADLRTYEHPILIERLDRSALDWDSLDEAAGKIFKSVRGLNRCVLNLGGGLPRDIQIKPAYMTKERLDLLRDADELVMAALRRYELYNQVWQCPTVFLPLEFDGKGQEFCIMRPILSARGMTATFARLPKELLDELASEILALPGISGFGYDITSKPPGTIEWE